MYVCVCVRVHVYVHLQSASVCECICVAGVIGCQHSFVSEVTLSIRDDTANVVSSCHGSQWPFDSKLRDVPQ